jgi:hypothetical protein
MRDQKYERLETSSTADVEMASTVGAGSTVDQKERDPHFDPELKKYGGRFDRKVAIGQVTFRFPLEFDPLNLIALLYGFLPWAVPITFGLSAAITRHFVLLYGLIVSVVTSLVNEVGLKPFFNDPRPLESANRHADGSMKPGMPSGHVLNATTIMVWAALEVALSGPGFDDHPRLTEGWLIFILLLMGPVPWARWYNSDHTIKQCIVAGVLGILVGALAYYLRATYFEHHWKPWDDMIEVDSDMSGLKHSAQDSRAADDMNITYHTHED